MAGQETQSRSPISWEIILASLASFCKNRYPTEIILLCVNEYRAGLATKLSQITTWGFGDNRRGSLPVLVPGLS